MESLPGSSRFGHVIHREPRWIHHDRSRLDTLSASRFNTTLLIPALTTLFYLIERAALRRNICFCCCFNIIYFVHFPPCPRGRRAGTSIDWSINLTEAVLRRNICFCCCFIIYFVIPERARFIILSVKELKSRLEFMVIFICELGDGGNEVKRRARGLMVKGANLNLIFGTEAEGSNPPGRLGFFVFLVRIRLFVNNTKRLW